MITFSRAKFETFLTCQRRFYLRYIGKVPWPHQPTAVNQQTAMQMGELFHQLTAQYYLNMLDPEQILAELEDPMKLWWQNFLATAPSVKKEERPLVELTLTLPVGDHQLLGRFDMIMVGNNQAHIYDWKTGKPRSADALQNDWQTRLYLALVVEGRHALGLPDLTADQVSMTYWYGRDPSKSHTINYTNGWHEENWAQLSSLIHQIDALPEDDREAWPLIPQLTPCQSCGYRNYCGRFEAESVLAEILAERDDEQEEKWADLLVMEPPA